MSFFTKLASYSQNPEKESLENFTTEVLSHLINHDKIFQKQFLELLLKKSKKSKVLHKQFKNCTSWTQQPYHNNGIVDLVLRTKNDAKILVEVKINATETYTYERGNGWQSQIQKYMSYKKGPVAYLTTNHISEPEGNLNKKNYLGHFYFEELYALLDKRKLCEIGIEFKKFMEENKMTPPKPFTIDEVRHAKIAFNFASKCKSIIHEVRKGIEPFFKENINRLSEFTQGEFNTQWNYASFYSKKFNHPLCNIVWFSIWYDRKLYYGVGVSGPEENLRKLNTALNWILEDGELSTVHEITGGEKNLIKKMITQSKKDMGKLKVPLKKYK